MGLLCVSLLVGMVLLTRRDGLGTLVGLLCVSLLFGMVLLTRRDGLGTLDELSTEVLLL